MNQSNIVPVFLPFAPSEKAGICSAKKFLNQQKLNVYGHHRPVWNRRGGSITHGRFCPDGLIFCSLRKYIIRLTDAKYGL